MEKTVSTKVAGACTRLSAQNLILGEKICSVIFTFEFTSKYDKYETTLMNWPVRHTSEQQSTK
jgi:hypothetical protein